MTSDDQIKSKMCESTAFVRVKTVHDNSVKEKIGTAYIHDEEGHVLTNAHVVATLVRFKQDGEPLFRWLQGDVSVKFGPGMEICANVIAVDFSFNLALLKLPANSLDSINPVSYAEGLPVEWAHLFCVGHPYGFPYAVKHGRVSNPEVLHALVPSVIEMDMEAGPGMLGAPLFTCDGKVFGILNSYMPGDGKSFGVPLSSILEFVRREKNRTGDVFVQGAAWACA